MKALICTRPWGYLCFTYCSESCSSQVRPAASMLTRVFIYKIHTRDGMNLRSYGSLRPPFSRDRFVNLMEASPEMRAPLCLLVGLCLFFSLTTPNAQGFTISTTNPAGCAAVDCRDGRRGTTNFTYTLLARQTPNLLATDAVSNYSCGSIDLGVSCRGQSAAFQATTNRMTSSTISQKIQNNNSDQSYDLVLLKNPYSMVFQKNPYSLNDTDTAKGATACSGSPVAALKDLTYFYGCSESAMALLSKPYLHESNLTCQNDGSTYSFTAPSYPPMFPELLYRCYGFAVAPSLRANLINSVDLGGLFWKALWGGFNPPLFWGDTSDENRCVACERLGGWCGYERWTRSSLYFQCLCKSGFCSTSTEPDRTRENRLFAIRMTALSVTALSIYLVSLLVFLVMGEEPENSDIIEVFLKKYGSHTLKRYKLSDVKRMTQSFGEKLGEGGFGSVYKGKFHDGRPIAVKLLTKSQGSGEDFDNEVSSIGRTYHVNIVNLLGFCSEGSKRALIYEYMPNGSLDRFLFTEGGSKAEEAPLGWETLYKIALGVAKGLQYLHKGLATRIVHFDIKPHNILLDEDFCPKIADFGLAKLCPSKESKISMTCARGTIGYLAPEVFSRNFGVVSSKSDVYSYGMILLEMVGGKKNAAAKADQIVSSEYFPEWIYDHLDKREHPASKEVMDESVDVTRKMAIVGLWCIQTNPEHRPSISRVIEMLEGDIAELEIPSKPYLYSPPSPIAENSDKEALLPC